VEFFRIMADTSAQALDRIRAVGESAERATQLEFLATASVELASSLDYESTLRRVAWLAVPDFADWCAIALEEDGGLRTLAVAHADPAKLSIAEDYERRYSPDPETSASYRVLRTGEPELTPEISDAMLEAAVDDPERLEMLRALAFKSALVVPLSARGRTLGTMTWVNGETGRRFRESDVAFGTDLGRRAAVAIDNAQLHSELQEISDRLQRAVVPPELPQPEGWRLGAYYSTPGRTEVGGDFYDAIPLPDGRLALLIGDVMGRGVEAAVSMSQIRAAVRAYVAVNPEPVFVLQRLDLLYERCPSNQLVTLAYAVADPARDLLEVAVAGHPPPLLLLLTVAGASSSSRLPGSSSAPGQEIVARRSSRSGRGSPWSCTPTASWNGEASRSRRASDGSARPSRGATSLTSVVTSTPSSMRCATRR
jgi:hypothetical protein